MRFDVASYLGAMERTVTALDRDGKPARAVRLSRIYKTNIEDLWDALTNEERLPRWLLPVEGADADIASGAEPASARAAARETTAFYTGEAPQDG